MKMQEEIIRVIDLTLKNPIYQTIKLLDIANILKKANFIKKREGVAPFLIVLHFRAPLKIPLKNNQTTKRQNTSINSLT